jgi:hypothetical protein
MALNAKTAEGGGKSVPTLDAGAYPARLVIIASLGLQEQSFNGEKKDPRIQIQTVYELLDEFMEDEDGNELPDKPRWMWEDFSMFNLASEKANSSKRYVALDPELKYEGDWSKLIGTPCTITLVVNEGRGKNKGKMYNNIANVSTMRSKDADKAPELVGTPLVFDHEEPDVDVFKALPDAIQGKIKESLDFKGGPLDVALGGAPQKEEPSSTDDAGW